MRTESSAVRTPLPSKSAMPELLIIGQAGIATELGMELRDFFAAHVMAEIGRSCKFEHEHAWDGMASVAYAFADAMVRVRKCV